MTRERALAEACADLAGPPAEDHDVIEVLSRLTGYCVRLLPITEAAVVLAGDTGGTDGTTGIVTATGDHARHLTLRALEWSEGPGQDCVRDGRPVAFPDLTAEAAGWSRYATLARQRGFRSGHALPLRRRDTTIGALTLLRDTTGAMPEDELRIAQALADVTTSGILAERAVREHAALAGQLQSALDSRIVIEQAKGVLAERGRIGTDAAFTALRGYARSTNQRIGQLARGIIDGTVDTTPIIG